MKQAAGEEDRLNANNRSMGQDNDPGPHVVDENVTFETKEDGTRCMTILFPPDPPLDSTSEPRKRGSSCGDDDDKESSGKKAKADPSVIEIRLYDSDDEDVDSASSQLSTPPKGTDVPVTEELNTSIPSNLQEDYSGFYDEEMTAGEVSTMIQRCRVMVDFFAAGQMSHGRPFSQSEIDKIKSNISTATFFSNSELNRLFKQVGSKTMCLPVLLIHSNSQMLSQVLMIPAVSTYFTVLVETIATVFYTEEDIKRDFLPQFITRNSNRSKAYLGNPLRHYRSFQRCFMVIMGFNDPFAFDKIGMMRRVTKDLSRCRKTGFPSTKMMNNNRSASFKLTSSSTPAATPPAPRVGIARTANSPRCVIPSDSSPT